MSDQHSIFLASSPRHLLLYAGLALSCRGQRNRLFFIEHIPAAGVDGYLSALAAWRSSPFESAERLKADYRPLLEAEAGDGSSSRKRDLKWQFRRDNRERLAEVIRSSPPARLYASCDDFYEAQYALRLATQVNPGVRRIYVEDGVSAYEYSFRKQHIRNWPKEVTRKLSYGPWWKPTLLPGTSGWFHEGYVAFPELAQDKLKRLDLRPMPREWFLSDSFREFALCMADQFAVNVARLEESDLIVAVTCSRWGRFLPGYRETMVSIIDDMLAAGKKVAVKLHPREPESDPLGLEGRPGLYYIPSQAMFEVLMVLVRRPDLTVVGDASTALVATRWLRPDVRVIALRHDPNGVDKGYLEELFKALEIPVEVEPRRLPGKYFKLDNDDRSDPASADELQALAR